MSIIKGIFKSKIEPSEMPEPIGLDLLFKEFYNRLVYFSYQLVRDKHQAQDIVQDAFIKYWGQQQNVAPAKAAIKNYLYSIVRNASLNAIRHGKVADGYLQNVNKEPEEPPVIEAIIAAEVLAELHTALQSLPENYRTISFMGYFDDMKNQEIADELDMSVNTVKKQKQRALQLLRLKLEPEMFIVLLGLLPFCIK